MSFEQKILVVDDTEMNTEVLDDVLSLEYTVFTASDGIMALETAIKEQPDIILLDIMMPGMNGYEVCEKLKADDKTKNIPVVFLTALTDAQNERKGLALGAVDYITKPFNLALLKERVKNHLDLKSHRDNLMDLVAERTQEILKTQEATIAAMGIVAEFRDPETGAHINRTRNYVLALCTHLKKSPKFENVLDSRTVELLHISAPLHDIGKVGVADHILLKPGKLTDEEFDEMKNHTVYGRNIINTVEERFGKSSFLAVSKEIAFGHHEKWNGKGYPQGLKGEEIPLSARLMALGDVYDAIITKRVYHPPLPHYKAVEIILSEKGTHFDPDLVTAFDEIQEQFREIALEFTDCEEQREVLLADAPKDSNK